MLFAYTVENAPGPTVALVVLYADSPENLKPLLAARAADVKSSADFAAESVESPSFWEGRIVTESVTHVRVLDPAKIDLETAEAVYACADDADEPIFLDSGDMAGPLLLEIAERGLRTKAEIEALVGPSGYGEPLTEEVLDSLMRD